MCGINFLYKFGKEINEKEKKIFIKNCIYNVTRGRDGFGIAVIDKNNKIHIIKNNKSLSDDINKVYNFVKQHKAKFLLCHTRQATSNNTHDLKNFHPFATKNFILVHNGVINNDERLKETYNLNYEETTDSAVLINLIQHFYNKTKNETKSIQKALNEISGSLACVLIFYNNNKFKIYMFRKNNPLWLGYSNENNLLLCSSEKEHIEKSISKKKIFLKFFEKYEKEIDMIFKEIDENKIYEITDEEIKVVGEFETKSYSYYYETTSYNYNYNWLNKKEAKKLSRFLKKLNIKHRIIEYVSCADILINLDDLLKFFNNDIEKIYEIKKEVDIENNEIKIEYKKEAKKLKKLLNKFKNEIS